MKKITQWQGQQKSGDRRRGNNGEVGFGLFVSERAQPRGYRVAGPAANIEDPEQAAPVPDQGFELHSRL